MTLEARPDWTPQKTMRAWYCGAHAVFFERDRGCPLCLHPCAPAPVAPWPDELGPKPGAAWRTIGGGGA